MRFAWMTFWIFGILLAAGAMFEAAYHDSAARMVLGCFLLHNACGGLANERLRAAVRVARAAV